ncbi:MAG TPA: hypothetical protein VMU45_01220 [Candidatus Eisenbacteria bacterium]|nr:hypothetical protein [Candidatus Eisenbacteria bacterium]
MLARKPHPHLPDYDIVTLQVDRAEPVEGKANLLTSLVGGLIEPTVRRALLGAAQVNGQLRCRAKLTPDGAMCEPHPEADDFGIVPPLCNVLNVSIALPALMPARRLKPLAFSFDGVEDSHRVYERNGEPVTLACRR